ncbi:MAG TPA: (d)CMP kinase [Ktedonobacteraceae bacterium]|jgi:cytidylate kinase
MQWPRRIAIDGPAGSGKSTIGEQLARRLGYLYIDTGAMYRAVTWLALHNRVAPDDNRALTELARHAAIVISRPQVADGRQYTVTVQGRDVTWDIRSTAVTNAVSQVSSHQTVRNILVERQRDMARQGHVVMVGRDIGSVVLPDAELKLYLTASLGERARRRYAELLERLGEHNPALPAFETVRREIEQRDAVDHVRMQPARDAIIVETDCLGIQQVLDNIYQHVEKPA